MVEQPPSTARPSAFLCPSQLPVAIAAGSAAHPCPAGESRELPPPASRQDPAHGAPCFSLPGLSVPPGGCRRRPEVGNEWHSGQCRERQCPTRGVLFPSVVFSLVLIAGDTEAESESKGLAGGHPGSASQGLSSWPGHSPFGNAASQQPLLRWLQGGLGQMSSTYHSCLQFILCPAGSSNPKEKGSHVAPELTCGHQPPRGANFCPPRPETNLPPPAAGSWPVLAWKGDEELHFFGSALLIR